VRNRPQPNPRLLRQLLLGQARRLAQLPQPARKARRIHRRLHTARLNVADEAAQAVGRFAERYAGLVGEVARMKARAITDTDAKAAIYDALDRGILPVRLLPVVGREYFNPSHDYGTGATLWRLHNAFTSAMKALSPARQMAGLTALGRYFSHLLN
jgi:hypothetical protein